jgi:regulator of nonsense transcripts 1
MGSVTTIRQQFYSAPLPPITLEHIDLASLTTKSTADLVATLSDSRLGIAASYAEKCVLDTLAFSTESRVLLITMNASSRLAKRQMKILRDDLLCNISLEKHGFFMERLAAALYLDFGLYIRNAFDINSDGDNRGSMAAYKAVLARARAEDSLNESVVEYIFTEQAFILSRKAEFALRAWACYVAVQGVPERPGVIDTSVKDSQARSIYRPYMVIT